MKKWVGRKFTAKRVVTTEAIEHTVAGAGYHGRKPNQKAQAEEAERVKVLVARMRERPVIS